MRNLLLIAVFVFSLTGITNAQERQASLPQGREVDRQVDRVQRDRVEAARSRAEAADKRSAEKQVDAVRAGTAADRANEKGHGIEAAHAEKAAERAASEASKAKAEAREAQEAYDRERAKRDRPN